MEAPLSNAAFQSLTRIAELAIVMEGARGVSLSSVPVIYEDQRDLSFSSWKVMARLEGDEYVRTDWLRTGDKGAMAFPISCFEPISGDHEKGWIGSGSNRFRIEAVVPIGLADFHLGEVHAGGFHDSKPNLRMWRDEYTDEERRAARKGRRVSWMMRSDV